MNQKILLAMTVVAAISALAIAAPVPDSLYRLYATREFDRAEALLEHLRETAGPGDRFAVKLAHADFLLDKRGEYAQAGTIYRQLLDEFPNEPLLPDVIYRLALALELQEKYLEAAQQYELVATRHMDSRFGEDALDAIERCFRKNYQDRVAFVGGYPITRIELDDRISRAPAAYEQFERKEFLLDTMIDNRLLYRAALDAGMLYAQDLTEEHEFVGITHAFWDMRNRYVFDQWHNRTVTAHAEPTERDLRAAYREERDSRFTTPEKVHAWQIIVPRRELADSLRRLLLGRDPVPWETLSARYSTAPNKDRAGDLGLFSRGMRDKAIEDAAFRLRAGQVSRPVQLGDTAWALIRVTNRTPKEVTPYNEARNQLVARVRQDKTEQLYEQKTDQLAAAVEISVDTIALDEGRDTVGVVDGVTITSAAIARRIEQIPVFFRSQFQTPEGVRRILEQLILEQLILKDAEANHDWLANEVVDRVLDRRARMLVDHYTRKMTTDKVVLDSAEVRTEYRATIDEYRVPARVRASEITASSRARAGQLHRWATRGSLPELISGHALLLPDPDSDEITDLFLETDDPEEFIAAYGFSESPRVILPGTPTLRVGNRLLPDMGQRWPIAGPYGAARAFGMGFADRSGDDTLFLPTLLEAGDGEALAGLLGTEPERDETGTVLVDENRLGTYVRFAEPLARDKYRKLFLSGEDEALEQVVTEHGPLRFRVTERHEPGPAEFEEIARRFSTAPSRHSGGDMSWLERDNQAYDEQVIAAAFRLNPGAVSPVIKVNDSTWTFIKVEEKQAAYTRPLEEVWPTIESRLLTRESERLREQLIADLRAGTEIEKLLRPEDFIFEVYEDEPLPDEDALAPETDPEAAAGEAPLE